MNYITKMNMWFYLFTFVYREKETIIYKAILNECGILVPSRD